MDTKEYITAIRAMTELHTWMTELHTSNHRNDEPRETMNTRKRSRLSLSMMNVLAGVWTEDINLQLMATHFVKWLSSIEPTPPIDLIIQSGVVPRIVAFLKMEGNNELQSAAASALSNIAAENAKIVIDHGAVPIFVKLLTSPSGDDVRQQVIWALGNVAPECRDLVLEPLIPFVSQLNEQADHSMLRMAAWALSNFCGETPPSLNVLPALARLIRSSDEHVLADACWTLAHLFDGTSDIIEAVNQAEIVPRVVELLNHSSPLVLIYALRTVGNIVARTETQTKVIIDNGALPYLRNLLKGNYSKSIKKAACWTISNIIAGNKECIQAVLDAEIILWLVKLICESPSFKKAAEFVIKQEAAWAISNATSVASAGQIEILVAQNCVLAFWRLLDCADPNIVTVCLEGLHNMLKFGDHEKILRKIKCYGWFSDIMVLREIHHISHIREKAKELMDSYWPEELKAYFLEEDETISPPGTTVTVTMTGKRRISPCPSPFPIESNQRLNPGVEIPFFLKSRGLRILNAYLDETRPIKRRRLKWEETSSIKDVRVRYYRGFVINDGAPTMDVVDLSEPKEDTIPMDLDKFCAPGETNSAIRDYLTKMDALEGAYEDVKEELCESLDVFKSSNQPACLDIYDFERGRSERAWNPDRKMSEKLSRLHLEEYYR